MQKFKLLFVVMAVVCMSTPAIAIEAVMDQVVVTATRTEEAITTVPANVTVVTREEIEQSPAETVPEVLRNVAGVLVSDVTGSGRTYNVDLRGFGETGPSNTLVLIDGRRVNVADGSGADWALIPKDRVARIEIVRGGRGSVLYGDNAAGGVINIITRQGMKDLAVSVGGAFGSDEMAKGDVFVSKAGNDWSVALNANYRIADGYRENSDTLAKDVGLDLGYDVTDRFSLSFSGGYHEDDAGMPGRLTDGDLASGIKRTESVFPDDYADTKDWYAQIGSRYFVNGNSYLNLGLSQRDRETEAVNVFFGTEYFTVSEFDIQSVAPQLVLNEQLFGLDSNVLLGFDYEESDLDVHSGSAFFASKHELNKESKGYYAHADIAVTEPLSISGGFRRDQAEYSFRSIDTGDTGSNKTEEDLYTAGVNFRFMENSSVYASYAKSFRYPHLDEMFDRFSNTVNIDLKTQKSDDYEVGVKFNLESGLNLGVSLFHIKTEDELIYNPNAGWFGANENLDGDSIRRGVELTFSKPLFDVLVSGSYTYRDTDIDGGQFDGSELPFVPEHQATLGAQAELCKNVRLGVNASYVGERHFISDFNNTDGLLDDYVNLSSKLSYLLEAGSVYLAINNILNEEYSEYGTSPYASKAYYPSPKANFTVGVNFKF